MAAFLKSINSLGENWRYFVQKIIFPTSTAVTVVNCHQLLITQVPSYFPQYFKNTCRVRWLCFNLRFCLYGRYFKNKQTKHRSAKKDELWERARFIDRHATGDRRRQGSPRDPGCWCRQGPDDPGARGRHHARGAADLAGPQQAHLQGHPQQCRAAPRHKNGEAAMLPGARGLPSAGDGCRGWPGGRGGGGGGGRRQISRPVLQLF